MYCRSALYGLWEWVDSFQGETSANGTWTQIVPNNTMQGTAWEAWVIEVPAGYELHIDNWEAAELPDDQVDFEPELE